MQVQVITKSTSCLRVEVVGLDSVLQSVIGVGLILRDHQFPRIQVCHEVLGSESEVQDLSELVLCSNSQSWPVPSDKSLPDRKSVASRLLTVQVSRRCTRQFLRQVSEEVVDKLFEVLRISCIVRSVDVEVVDPVSINGSCGRKFLNSSQRNTESKVDVAHVVVECEAPVFPLTRVTSEGLRSFQSQSSLVGHCSWVGVVVS